MADAPPDHASVELQVGKPVSGPAAKRIDFAGFFAPNVKAQATTLDARPRRPGQVLLPPSLGRYPLCKQVDALGPPDPLPARYKRSRAWSKNVEKEGIGPAFHLRQHQSATNR